MESPGSPQPPGAGGSRPIDLVRDGDRVALFLEHRDDDAEQPSRHLYWLRVEPMAGWRGWFAASTVDGWLGMAVPSEYQGGDKRQWRLMTRYAVVRLRHEPDTALGVSAPVLGDVRWERVEA